MLPPLDEPNMLEAKKLREQAEKVLRLAHQMSDDLTATRLTALAEEYIARAKSLEERKQP
jgi:hypothetical protein